MTTETTEAVYNAIQRVSLFLEDRQADFPEVSATGPALLAMDLQSQGAVLLEGEIDHIVLFPTGDENPRWDCRWVGGPRYRGRWVEIDGKVLDAFADERMREKLGEAAKRYAQLPLFYRTKDADRAVDITYSAGSAEEPTAQERESYGEYRRWLEEGRDKLVQTSWARIVLEDDNFDWAKKHLPWLVAVETVDHRGIPPTRTRSQPVRASASPPQPALGMAEASSSGARAPIEERDIVREAIESIPDAEVRRDVYSMMERNPISYARAAIAALVGSAAGYTIYLLWT